MPDNDTPISARPRVAGRLARSARASRSVWIVPIVAALAGVWVAVTQNPERGAHRSRSSSNRPRGSRPARPRSSTTASSVGTITDDPPLGRPPARDHHRADGAQDRGLSGRGYAILGRATAHLGRQRQRLGHADLRLVHRHGDRQVEGQEARIRRARHAAGGDRRHARRDSSCSRHPTSARSTPARRSSSGACRSARWRRTSSTRTGSR